MRLLSTLPIIGRTPSVRPPPFPLVLVRNASRLSSIHNGLRRSMRTRPPRGPTTGSKLEIRQPETARPYLTPDEYRRGRAEARQNPITFKIKKGKKDVTQPAGPGRITTAKRYSDPRDPLGQGSLLKQFKTGKLLNELKEVEEYKGELQHDAFTRQMLAGDVENLLNSRKHPVSRGRSKRKSKYDRPHEQKAPASCDSDGRPCFENMFGQDSREMDTPREADKFNRSDRRAPGREVNNGSSGSERPVRDHHNRDAPEEAGRSGRAFPQGGRGFDRPGPNQRGRDTTRESDPFARAMFDGEASRGGSGHERLDRDQRGSGNQPSDDLFSVRRIGDKAPSTGSTSAEKWDVNAEGSDGQAEKPRKKYEPPMSIPYTTAASQFLYGTSTVEAALLSSRRKFYKLYIYQGANRTRHEKDGYLASLASKQDVPVVRIGEDQLSMLNKMSSSGPHNGHVLEASPLPLVPVTALGKVSGEESWPGFNIERGHQSAEDAAINGTSDFITTAPSSHKPLILLLDAIQDPQNLGAIIRTASFMGVSAVVTSKKGSAPVTPAVLKASSGAAETMTLLTTESSLDFLTQSKMNGWRVYAAVPPKRDSKHQVDMRHVESSDPLLDNPCILVMGNEGQGLSSEVRRCATSQITIPNMSGSNLVDSLNVSVATGLLCSSFVRRRSTLQNSGVSDAGAMF